MISFVIRSRCTTTAVQGRVSGIKHAQYLYSKPRIFRVTVPASDFEDDPRREYIRERERDRENRHINRIAIRTYMHYNIMCDGTRLRTCIIRDLRVHKPGAWE